MNHCDLVYTYFYNNALFREALDAVFCITNVSFISLINVVAKSSHEEHDTLIAIWLARRMLSYKMDLISFCHFKYGNFQVIVLYLDTSKIIDNSLKIHLLLNEPPC